MAAPGLIESDVKNPVLRWIDQRMPIFTMMEKEYGSFPTPRNFNYLWNFGAMAMVTLWTGSGWPDLILGCFIILLALHAAREVWEVSEEERLAVRALDGESLDG